jgi:hypothetical protein
MFLFFQAEKAKAEKAVAEDKIKTLPCAAKPIAHSENLRTSLFCVFNIPQKIRFVNAF